MKRTSSFLAALCLTALCSVPFISEANVISHSVADSGISITSPEVQLPNPVVAKAINEDLAPYFRVDLAKLQEQDIVSKNLSFTVKYEDEQWLSIIVHDYIYRDRAAHGMHYDTGLVYNKMTGERVPLSYFVNIKDMNQIYLGLLTKSIPFTSLKGTGLSYNYAFKLDSDMVPNNYFLDGDARVGIIFQPYEMGPYSLGTTVALLPGNYIKGLNIINANK